MEGNFWISNVKLHPPGVSDQIQCANAVNCLWKRWCVGATKTHHHPKFVSWRLPPPGVARKVDYYAQERQLRAETGKYGNPYRRTHPPTDRNTEDIKESANMLDSRISTRPEYRKKCAYKYRTEQNTKIIGLEMWITNAYIFQTFSFRIRIPLSFHVHLLKTYNNVWSFIICTRHQILLGRSNQEEWDGQGMWHAWARG
jgi:hypothetical protein